MRDMGGFHGGEQDELPVNLLAGLREPYQSSLFDLVQLRPTCMQTVTDTARILACCLLQLPSETFGRGVPSCWTNNSKIVDGFLKQAHAGVLDFGRHVTVSC